MSQPSSMFALESSIDETCQSHQRPILKVGDWGIARVMLVAPWSGAIEHGIRITGNASRIFHEPVENGIACVIEEDAELLRLMTFDSPHPDLRDASSVC